MLVSMGNEGNTHPLLRGMHTSTDTMETSVTLSQEDEIDIPQDPAIVLLGIHT